MSSEERLDSRTPSRYALFIPDNLFKPITVDKSPSRSFKADKKCEVGMAAGIPD